jgi:hypothetical protein
MLFELDLERLLADWEILDQIPLSIQDIFYLTLSVVRLLGPSFHTALLLTLTLYRDFSAQFVSVLRGGLPLTLFFIFFCPAGGGFQCLECSIFSQLSTRECLQGDPVDHKMGPISYVAHLFMPPITSSRRNSGRSALFGKQQHQVTNSGHDTGCDFGPSRLLQPTARTQISAARVCEYSFIPRGLRRGGQLQRKRNGQASTV